MRKFKKMGVNQQVLIEHDVVGGGLRRGQCPKCNSRDRERLVYLYIKNELRLLTNESNLKVLHIAPESNLSERLKSKFTDGYICGDLFTSGCPYPEYVQNMDIRNIPYDNGYFDLIICNHVLEHIPDDGTAMKELHRVLSATGRAILMVPISLSNHLTIEDITIKTPEARLERFGQSDHVRIYGQDFTEKLMNAGFKVDRINLYQKYLRDGLNEKEDLYVAMK